MKLGSLFSGIGGFELAATWAGIEPVWSNEIDPFACKVLTKNFNHEIIEKDIREIGKHNLQPVDIISGGFPCQPFSHAGKRQGTEDNRYLWPEMLRVIRELKPSWVIGENVAGLLSMENGETLKKILSDLEAEGYHNEVFIIPSCAKGAWHRRDRIWIICNSKYNGLQDRHKKTRGENPGGKQGRMCESEGASTQPKDVPNSDSKRRCSRNAVPGMGNLANGLPPKLDGYWNQEPEGIPRVATGVPDRAKRLMGLGNTIVPQVAYELFKAIKTISETSENLSGVQGSSDPPA